MAKLKVVITDFGDADYHLEAKVFSASGLDIDLVRLNARTPAELLPTVVDADALLVQWVKITPEIIRQLTRCKIISRYGIGVDMVDLQAAGQQGILVCNVPDYCIEEVSTHTITCLLTLNRRLLIHRQHTQSGKWGSPPGGPPERLAGQTLGIVGLGNIGREVARKAMGLGLKVVGYDPYLPIEQAAALGVELTGLVELLRQSDYVALHCPLTQVTHHLIGDMQLALMKSSAYLINMARGAVVDQSALYQALTNGVIRGAALDVLEQEPPAPDDPLLQLDNVLITPHVASWSSAAIEQLRRQTAQNVVMVLNGQIPPSLVNRQYLSLSGLKD